MDRTKLTEEEIEKWKIKIDDMSQIQMASLWRFAPSGHPVFDKRYPLFEYFNEKFNEKGGMTPSISKALGWG